jgi:hypothetical protein
MAAFGSSCEWHGSSTVGCVFTSLHPTDVVFNVSHLEVLSMRSNHQMIDMTEAEAKGGRGQVIVQIIELRKQTNRLSSR